MRSRNGFCIKKRQDSCNGSAEDVLAAEGRLAAVSPFSVMNRGYAMLMDERGTPLTTAQAAKIGQAVRIRMKDGILQAEVTGKAVFADGEKETNL